MINPSLKPLWLNDKQQELTDVIGKEVSENYSPTLRAKLIGFNGSKCIMEIVPSPYELNTKHNHLAGKQYLAPVYRIWNAYFF